MKNPVKFSLALILIALLVSSCDGKVEDSTSKKEIVHQSVKKDIVLIRDVETLQARNDEISNHVDSILTGLLDAEFVSTGQQILNLGVDMDLNIGFEIINLNPFNPNALPESFDSLAARVIPISVEILDNSTFGYPDALDLHDQISENGNWTDRESAVLGTFLNAGQFQGNGEKFLGIRFSNDNKYKYGWIKLYCSQHNDTLRIIDFAYNNIDGSKINAGQKE